MSDARSLLVFPCNGNGVEALDCLGDAYRCVGFVDDTPAKRAAPAYGHTVFEREILRERADAAVLAVPGSPLSYRSRRAIIEGLGVSPDRFARVIHPSARVAKHATIGRNVLIMAGVVLTSNAVIGDHVIILPNTVLMHDVVVHDWAVIGAKVMVAAGTTLGVNCYVGGGSSLINGITIGEGALVGLGSVVIHDVPAGARVVGNPAHVLANER
jgi:sugar O-acyltransferase (sialic acid O-acetyltransferase NeuD family)